MYGDKTEKCLQKFVISYGTSPRNRPILYVTLVKPKELYVICFVQMYYLGRTEIREQVKQRILNTAGTQAQRE